MRAKGLKSHRGGGLFIAGVIAAATVAFAIAVNFVELYKRGRYLFLEILFIISEEKLRFLGISQVQQSFAQEAGPVGFVGLVGD